MRFILILSLMLSANAYSDWTIAKIDKVLFYEQGSLYYIYPEGGVTNPPSCHGSNGDYISFSTTRPMAKEYISGLLAAFMANKTVSFRTYGSCDDQSVSDTLMYFTINK